MRVANLIILSNVSDHYSYQVPDDLNVCVGDFVDITFSKRPMVGLVISLYIATSNDFSYSLLAIQGIHQKRVNVPFGLRLLIDWFSEHYCTTPFHALQCIVGLKKKRDQAPLISKQIQTITPLTSDQVDVFDSIRVSSEFFHLIHGVTGSGKTQVYAHLIQDTINRGQSAIMMIPEISLTPQFTSFFSSIFASVVVVHSGLTSKKKEEIWNQCLRGEIQVVIGPRSAIFMPFEDLGLIIIDEEHDSSYKQENSPRYYTHEVAMKRAKIHNAKLVFGSATPSLVTYAMSKGNGFCYHRLLKRYNDISMPQVHILDMKTTQRHFLIHDDLVDKIKEIINKDQKVLLLVNRRGYSSYLKCNACGSPQLCPSCQTSYTYHSDGYFRCHRCLSTKKMTRLCSECGQNEVEYYGIGIQKVTYELKHLFPNAVVTRIDRDTVKNYAALETALEQVNNSDILIGTQMIAKGHNFPNVGLVGIIGVDTMLNFPDFRSSERMFQLMTQMAGRAGRDLSGSDVYIQTFQPEHYSFSFVRSHDVSGFLNQEYEFREPFGYPPFKSIVNIIFSSKDNSKAASFYPLVNQFNDEMKDRFGISIIGPKVAPIEKVSDFYRHNVFYKIPQDQLLKFKKWLRKFPKKSGIRCVFDIDPQSLL